MAGHVSDSHLTELSFTVSRPRIPFGWRYMGPDVKIWSAVCSSAPSSQEAVEAMPHLCIDDRKRPTPVRRRFSRTQAGFGSPVPGGRSSLHRLPVFCRVQDAQVVCVNKLPSNCDRQVVGVDVKKEGSQD